MPARLTSAQEQVIAIAPKPSAVISFFASLYIIVKVLVDAENRKKMYHRLMAALSFHTALQSVWFFWGTWAIPEGLVYLSAGTTTTCTAQGFLIQFSLVIPSYYASLSVFAFFTMNSTAMNKFIHRIEPWMHVFLHIFPLASAIALQQIEMLNPNGPWCWIESFPPGCGKGTYPCMRGGDITTEVAMWAFAGAPFFFMLLLATVMMIMLYFMVRKRERTIANLLGKTKFMEEARHRRSRIVAQQGLLYLIIFYIYTFSATTRLIQLSTGSLHFPTIVIMIILVPLQGFFNLIVYISCERRSKIEYISTTQLPKSSLQLMTDPSTREFHVPQITCARRKFSFNIFDGTNPSDAWKDFIIEKNREDEFNTESSLRRNSSVSAYKSDVAEDEV